MQVGSGTDPTEGAALAGALLDALAGRSLLTLATTHHASLKDMAVSSFSPSPLAITYSSQFTLCTGQCGSYALPDSYRR